jgi:hypothetical protein
LHRRRWIIRTTLTLIPFITSLGCLGCKTIKFGLFVFVYLVGHFEVYSTRQKYIIYVRGKVTSHSYMKELTHSQLNKVCIEPSECYMKCL